MFLVFKNTYDTCQLYCLIIVVDDVVVVVLRRRLTQKSMSSERAASMNDRCRLHLQRFCCCCCFCYLMEIAGVCAMLENVQQRIFFTYSRIFAVFDSIFAFVPQLESSQLLMGDVTSLQRCYAQFK